MRKMRITHFLDISKFRASSRFVDILLSKYKNIVYNVILIIINRFTKIIKYLFVNIIIDIA